MAIRDVITRGFGNGTFDPVVNKLPTRGYSIGSAVVTDDSPYRTRTPDSNVYRHHAPDELINYRDRTLDNDTYRPTA